MPGTGLRLLALDGGGVRGLASLMILRRLMATVDPDAPPKPCDYFDMIGGTSTGGLIAIIGLIRSTMDYSRGVTVVGMGGCLTHRHQENSHSCCLPFVRGIASIVPYTY